MTTTLLNINFKRGILKLMLSIIEDDRNKEFQNSLKETLGWVVLRDNTSHLSELKVPPWSSSNQTLDSEQNFSQANLDYFTSITISPSQMHMNHEVVNRTLSIKKELGLS